MSTYATTRHRGCAVLLVVLGLPFAGAARAVAAEPPASPPVSESAQPEPAAPAPMPAAQSTSEPSAAAAANAAPCLVCEPPPPRASRFRWAVGLGIGAFSQPDQTWGVAPELVAYRYLPLVAPWFLRVGARVAMRGLDQSQLAGQIGITEHDIVGAGEAGVLYNWKVVPTFVIGASYTWRLLNLSNHSEIDSSASRTPSATYHPGVYLQQSVGLPLWGGAVVVEPYYRYEFVQGDRRLGSRIGIEASFGW